MKQMTMSKISVDTNILVYLLDKNLVIKSTTAANLVDSNPLISAQVVSEFLNVSKRLLKIPKLTLLKMCNEVFKNCIIIPTTQETLDMAEELIVKYDLQLFDSIIVTAALQANCTTLYSEDMHHGLVINGTLTVINPFI
jgi:predicted nucleic acid-binding protein